MAAGGVPAKLSDSDKKKVDELREQVKEYLTPYYDTDFNLLRWLIGHDYNIELLKPKLINHLILRSIEDWNLDGIAATPRNHPIHDYWKSGLTGEAGKTPNVIVNVEQSGANDYWGLLATHPTNQILRARVHDLESMLGQVMQMEARTGERASILYVMDLTGLKMDRNMTTLLSGALASISAFMSDHYVELIHSFVLVNVPSFIHAIWSLARSFLPERTRNKVKILGGKWRMEIAEMADVSVLPSYWNVEGSNVFTANIERGIPVPPAMYYKGTMPEDCETLTVKAGQTNTHDMQLTKGQTVNYLIHGDGQFAFAIYYSEDPLRDGEGIEKWKRVYPLFQTVTTSLREVLPLAHKQIAVLNEIEHCKFSKIPGPTTVPLKDSMKASKTGKYRLWVSNEHAWFHTLKITYKMNIEG